MRVLVTGGTGLIGSNIALELERQGHEVVITGNMYEEKLPGFKGKLIYNGILGINWDAIGQVDAVFHEAGISDPRAPDDAEMMRANFETSKAVFEYAAAHGVKHIVYASSTAVYGTLPAPYREDDPVAPYNAYGESKAKLDAWAMQFAKENPGIRVVGLRYCNVYGPGEMHKGNTATMIYQFAQQMQRGNPKLFKDGEQKRDYAYVKDVVRANLLALEAKESVVVNCGSGHATTFNRLVEILNQVMGLSRTPEYIDNPYGASYQSHTQCDMQKAKEKLGFVPEWDIEKGIKDYFDSGFLIRS